MNLVKEEKNQRDIIIADTGEVVSGSSNGSMGSRMRDSRAMTGQFGGEQIGDNFHNKTSAKNSRNAMYHQQRDGTDTMDDDQMNSPFHAPASHKRDRFGVKSGHGSNLDVPDYYAAKGGSASSS